MKRTRPSDIKALLAERNILPSRVLGQNFLIDQNILNMILDSAHLAPEDTVLEIGPGLGVLTEHLLAQAGRLIAIEKDPRLAAYLRETFGAQSKLRLIEGDALEQDLPMLLSRDSVTHVVSNLPYSAGTRILMELIDAPDRPLRMVVMLQQDVAARITAMPGGKDFGITAIHAQLYYDVILRKQVSRTCFHPPPDVRSALLEFYRKPVPVTALDDETHFRHLVKWCFSQRRKQLARTLLNAPTHLVPPGLDPITHLDALGIPAQKRPESLSIRQWGALSNGLVAQGLTPDTTRSRPAQSGST